MRLSRPLWNYPRIQPSLLALQHAVFHKHFNHYSRGSRGHEKVIIRGRVAAKRSAGQVLHFIDVAQCGLKVQAIAEQSTSDLTRAIKELHIGDYIEVHGSPGRHDRGELSIYTDTIERLTPCLHRIPQAYKDLEKRLRHRHIDFLVNHESIGIIKRRSQVIASIRRFLEERGFIEVETPILQTGASGASARPFETSSILGHELTLRIAPELSLKRAVVGGLDRVFEIGKCFRNEGLSRRHNPEFTTCEFYQAYAGLEDLISFTQELLRYLDPKLFNEFQRLDFMETLESRLGCQVPSTVEGLLGLFHERGIEVPGDQSLPGLYDALATKYIEPQCVKPTFIVNHPSCLSPLSKSTGAISHRFELVVNKMELINAYEEENDPVIQREKFMSQKGRLSADEEDYLSVLEYGLPPTGGWGLGIDRLVMLLTGSPRINEVLLGGGINYLPRRDPQHNTSRVELF